MSRSRSIALLVVTACGSGAAAPADAARAADAADAAADAPAPAPPIDARPTPALPLGHATATDAPGSCGTAGLPVSACWRVAISDCDGTDDTSALVKVSEPAGAAVGTIVFGGGGAGTAFYESTFGATGIGDLLAPLRAAGFRIVQRAWTAPGWMTGTGGARRLACRYATLLAWVHDAVHTGGGFCASGNSGGAAEVAYALAHYGMGDLLDGAVPSSGPPLGRLDLGCAPASDPAWPAECRALGNANGCVSCGFVAPADSWIDQGYGPDVHACAQHDTTWLTTWRDDSVAAPAAVLAYPRTAVRFVFGGADCSEAVPIGRLYAAAITTAHDVVIVPGAPHELPSTAAGATAVADALLAVCPH
jgi:hypothetical protein